MSGRWRIVLALSAVLAAACSSVVAPYRQYEIRFDAPAMPPLGTSPSDSELIDSIAWLMRHRLDLPFPADIKAYIYVNEATFVDGLIKIGGEKIDEPQGQKGTLPEAYLRRRGRFVGHALQEHRVRESSRSGWGGSCHQRSLRAAGVPERKVNRRLNIPFQPRTR